MYAKITCNLALLSIFSFEQSQLTPIELGGGGGYVGFTGMGWVF